MSVGTHRLRAVQCSLSIARGRQAPTAAKGLASPVNSTTSVAGRLAEYFPHSAHNGFMLIASHLRSGSRDAAGLYSYPPPPTPTPGGPRRRSSSLDAIRQEKAL